MATHREIHAGENRRVSGVPLVPHGIQAENSGYLAGAGWIEIHTSQEHNAVGRRADADLLDRSSPILGRH